MLYVKGKIILMIMSIILVFSACSPHIHLDFLGTSRIREVVLVESKAKEKILVIDLNGPIGIDPNPGILKREGNLLSTIYYRLQKASQDPHVKGIILRLDTPGGEGTASDIIYNEILRFKKKTGIPVLALMMGVAASGGYYVIAILPGIKEMLNKIGIEVNVIKSGKMKDAGGPWKDLSQEERDYYQDMVDELYHDFLQVVHRSRKDLLTMEEIKKIADGRVFHAKKALELKLIDAVGYFDDALKKILSLAAVRDANVIAYTYHPAKKTNIYANEINRDKPLSLEIKPFENLLPSLKTGIYYIWLPGMED